MAKRGPRTEAGRRRSALNALSHGVLARTPVIPGVEAEADWNRHLTGFHDSLAPVTPFEAFLVERIALTAWRLQRLELYESEMLSLAQFGAEEAAATRVLSPAGSAISLRGGTAASLIEGRINQLRRLVDLLLRLPVDAQARAQLSREDVELLYEGLNLALSRPGAHSQAFQRQVIEDLSATTPEEEARARDLASTVRGLLGELHEAVGGPAHPEALEGPELVEGARKRPLAQLVRSYPVELVLLTVWPEIHRLERELPDLDATIARVRRESLLLDPEELAKVTRYEAHLRRQLVQYLHELEALQTRRGGQPSPLARLDVQLLEQ